MLTFILTLIRTSVHLTTRGGWCGYLASEEGHGVLSNYVVVVRGFLHTGISYYWVLGYVRASGPVGPSALWSS